MEEDDVDAAFEQRLRTLYRRHLAPPPDTSAVWARLVPRLQDAAPHGTPGSPRLPPSRVAAGHGYTRRGYLSVAAVILLALVSAILFGVFGAGMRTGVGSGVPKGTPGVQGRGTATTAAQTAASGMPPVMLTRVQMLSNSEGWAIGGDVIAQYKQGRWTVAITVPHATLTGLSMVTSSEGWAVGVSDSPPLGIMLHYSQGQWTRIAEPPVLQADEYLASIAMLSASEGWAGSYMGDGSGNGFILHDVGGQWTRIAVRDAKGYPIGINRIDMLSSTEGWATVLGGSSSNSFLHYVGGQWTVVDAPHPGPTDLSMASATEGWAVGFNGPTGDTVLVHCTNGQWTTIPPAVADTVGGGRLHGLWGVSMISSVEGWAVGDQGAILHYTNGAWTRVSSPTPLALYAVQMVSPGEGWAVGERGIILHYQSGVWSIQGQV